MTDINIQLNISFIDEIADIDLKYIKPIIKWAGGKGQIIDNIFDKIPAIINNYFEPFIGGGAVLLELLKRIENKQIKLNGKIFINDLNKDLMNMYLLIKTDVNYLISQLSILENQYENSPVIEYPLRHKFSINLNEPLSNVLKKGKQYLYYYYREKYNKLDCNSLDRVSLFIFLNKTCFRGLYRLGKNGFNVPFGNYNKCIIYDKKQLKTLNIIFNKYDIIISSSPFNTIIEKIICNNKFKQLDFVYLDPPYYPVTDTSFVNYNNEGFNDTDNTNLLNICDILNSKNIKFLQSNSFCDYNKTNYKNYNIETIVTKRRIHSKNPQLTHYEILINN